ncbi:MAG: hypothetical protein FJ271_13095 [Planctomycetes bacterium]|nr:hypothetical protein [Planctomycetota bacterium]
MSLNSWNPWNEPAHQLARTVAWIRQFKSRGAIAVHFQDEAVLPRAIESGPIIIGIFSNEPVFANPKGQLMVACVRRELKENGLEELAFGFSEDLGTWAMMLAASDEHETKVGRDFHRELLLIELENMLWKARNRVYQCA